METLFSKNATINPGKIVKNIFFEYKRPWKLFTLSIGILLLTAGAFYYDAIDWDIPISFIMAILTYLSAPLSVDIILSRNLKYLPLMIFFTWFSVDGSYWLYWRFKNPLAVELMRDANFLPSFCLYWICGIFWYYRGSSKELIKSVKSSFIRL